ncbi:metallophosphoesterase family protein [Jannaschia sp. R86511]|uniref:metallophosphoesterase family protein n=1 Tax=Jannaschia sp. R86511 TaxID=3093853 RepID=UPI0036D35533
MSRRRRVLTVLTAGLLLLTAACSGAPDGTAASAAPPPEAAATTGSTGPLDTTAASTRIAVAGDTGTGSPDEQRTADAIAAAGPFDALVLLGDLVYPEGDPASVDDVVTTPFATTLAGGAVLVPVLGNHDHAGGEAEDIMSALGRDRGWYAEQVGTVRLVVLDTERVDDPEQTRWLEETLAAPAPAGSWTVVAMHRPAYSSGEHGSATDVREAWEDLFVTHGVALVLAGHDHDYERSTPQGGVVHVVSGAGAKLRPVGEQDFTAVSASVLHHLELDVTTARLDGRAVDDTGGLVDEFVLTR